MPNSPITHSVTGYVGGGMHYKAVNSKVAVLDMLSIVLLQLSIVCNANLFLRVLNNQVLFYTVEML